jgi:hypothetical protein
VAGRDHRWLLFVHQLPSTASNLRVRTWRRLQQLGALPDEQALYVLPEPLSAREGFEWLKSEIETAGGQASVFAARVSKFAGGYEPYQRRLWVTGPRPGVDRMASAWLVPRFVDPEAQFGFVADRDAVPPDAIPFDRLSALLNVTLGDAFIAGFDAKYTFHGHVCWRPVTAKRATSH